MNLFSTQSKTNYKITPYTTSNKKKKLPTTRKCLHCYLCKVKLATVVEDHSKASFLIATTQGVREGAPPFLGLTYFTLDLYLIMLSVKQGGIKYRFLSPWYDLTWD